MSHGRYFSCNEPTALTLMIHATPSFFIAQMLARWFSSLGQNFVAASVARKENDVAPGEFSGEKIVGRSCRTGF
jgi:hypothetical protein